MGQNLASNDRAEKCLGIIELGSAIYNGAFLVGRKRASDTITGSFILSSSTFDFSSGSCRPNGKCADRLATLLLLHYQCNRW